VAQFLPPRNQFPFSRLLRLTGLRWRYYNPPPHEENKINTSSKTVISSKNAVFWDVAPCSFCVNRRLGGTDRLRLQGRRISDRGSSLKMQAISSSETSVHTRPTWRHIPEDGILHSHRRENLKSYM
jgi:hypothetical protein